MFSFSTISVFATVALSAFTSALPLAARDLPIVGSLPVSGLASALPVGGALDSVTGLLPRADATTSLAVILTNAQAQLTPFAQQLQFANKQNATVESLTEPVNHIKAILATTTASVKALAGLPVETILADVTGTAVITVHSLATIVAAVLALVFGVLGQVLKVVDVNVLPAVAAILCEVGALVGELLAAVLAVVGGLVADLVPLIVSLLADVVPVVLNLNLATIISLLGL